MTDDLGVIAREEQRRKKWTDLGLPDPADVVSEEAATERLTGQRFRSPKRPELDSWFAAHPSDKPTYWS